MKLEYQLNAQCLLRLLQVTKSKEPTTKTQSLGSAFWNKEGFQACGLKSEDIVHAVESVIELLTIR